MDWLLDFDDTLVMGPNTWAFEEVLPTFIAKYGLPYNKALMESVTLKAQQQGNEGASEAEVLAYVFDSLQWPDKLKAELVQRVFNEYTPYLFPDTKPFLERLNTAAHRLYVVSNNNDAPALAQQLGIARYFRAIYTPKSCGRLLPKPHVDMWNHLRTEQAIEDEDIENVRVVGDDPWSDGRFAQHCGVDCWIIDRLGRYESIQEEFRFQRVESLAQVEPGQ